MSAAGPTVRDMPDLSNVTTPVEWVVTHSSSQQPIAVVRRLRLGPERQLYFRAVTWNADPEKRDLVGYWGSAEEAVQNVYGLYERSLPPQFLMTGGGTAREPPALTKPKAPPARQAIPDRRQAPRDGATHAGEARPSSPEVRSRPPARQLSPAGR